MQAIRFVSNAILIFGFAVGCGESPDVSALQPQRSALTAAHPNRHVLLVSLDGFHEIDLAKYVEAHPQSALAKLGRHGVTYTQAITTGPSDSYPGSLAMMTGGTPVSTGVLYDNSWDRSLSPQGSNCSTLGANALYDENADVNINDLNTTVDPNSVPRDPRNGCSPVMPHQYIKTNTIFEVIKAAGLRTAYSDKHPSYDIYNGPSGQGVDDLYTPEADANGQANRVAATEGNDELKVQSVINEIDGFDHTRTRHVGVPAIMGMDFQTPNVAMKIDGYAAADGTPSPGLAAAFDYCNGAVGRMLAELEKRELSDSTLVIVGSKHGNSPIDVSKRIAVDDGPFTDITNSVQPGIMVQLTDDTEAILWLSDSAKTRQVVEALEANIQTIAPGGGTVYSGDSLDDLLGGRMIPERRPDVIVRPREGVIYTSHTKFVEHGGFSDNDRHVALVISNPAIEKGTVLQTVHNTQIAPTVLRYLGLNPSSLQSVVKEHTAGLPGLDF